MTPALPLALSAVLAASPGGPKLAALDWTVTNVEPSLASFYSDNLARALRERGVSVVTTQEIATILGFERQKQLLKCSDGSTCTVELSNALGCDGTLVANLARLDSTLTANLKVLSARDGHTVVETSVEADTEKRFLERLLASAGVLADGVLPRPTEARRLTWLPAVGGGVLLAAGALGVGLSWSTAGTLDARLAADGRVTPAAVSLASQGKAYQTGGWILAGAGVAALAAAGVMALFGSDAPVQPTAVLGPSSAQLGVAGSFP